MVLLFELSKHHNGALYERKVKKMCHFFGNRLMQTK